jgi:hypothetical protein
MARFFVKKGKNIYCRHTKICYVTCSTDICHLLLLLVGRLEFQGQCCYHAVVQGHRGGWRGGAGGGGGGGGGGG